MKSNIKTALRLILFLSIGIFFIWLFVKDLTKEQIDEIINSVKNANYWWFVLSIVIGIFSHFFRTLRWKLLLEPMGYKPKTFNVFMAVFIAYLVNLAIPRLGEISRCGVLTKYEKNPFNKVLGTVVAERAFDLFTYFLLFIVMLFIFYNKIINYTKIKIIDPIRNKIIFNDINFFKIAATIFILVLLISLFYFFIYKNIKHNKIVGKIKELFFGFIVGIKSLVNLEKPLLFIFYTFLIWSFYLLMGYVVFFSIPETKHLGLDAAFIILIFGTIGIMVVQGGIGIYPAIVAETLLFWSIAHTKGYALGWLIWIAQNAMIIVVGIIAMIILPIYNRRKDEVRSNKK